ncbi:MAG: hypothetical protein ACYC9J_11685 [Sulfuricaulis sp.]
MYGQLIQLVLQMILGASIYAAFEDPSRSKSCNFRQGNLMVTRQRLERPLVSIDTLHGACSRIHFGRPMNEAVPVLNRRSVDSQKGIPDRLRTSQNRAIATSAQGMPLLLGNRPVVTRGSEASPVQCEF